MILSPPFGETWSCFSPLSSYLKNTNKVQMSHVRDIQLPFKVPGPSSPSEIMIHKQPGSFPRLDLLTDTGKRRWDVSLLNVTGEDEEPTPFLPPKTSALLR